MMDIIELVKKIACIREWEENCGSRMLLSIPEYWFDNPHLRCPNNHVGTSFLNGLSGDLCLQCFEPVVLTFPKDKNGPLVHQALENKS